jgi:hypothetical protein
VKLREPAMTSFMSTSLRFGFAKQKKQSSSEDFF